MKRTLLKLIAVTLLAGCLLMTMPVFGMAEEATSAWDGTSTASGFKSGNGSFGDPYVISTPEEFNYFAMFVTRNGITSKKYFVLENDLDFGGHTISSVGLKENNFSGIFDGRGHTISNFKISNSTAGEYTGLFGNIKGSTAEVKNFTIKDATISTDQQPYIGAVAGYLTSGTISNVILEDSVTVLVKDPSKAGSIGGVVGRCYGTIQYVVSSATVLLQDSMDQAGNFIGGIAGVTGNGTGVITSCISKGTITADGAVVGGISGISGAGKGGGRIEDCINLAIINSQVTAGGVLGKIHTDSGNFLTNCINLSTTIIAPAEKLGSIIGDIAKVGTVKGCATVEVTGVAKYGSGYSENVDLSAFEMNDISTEDAQAALTALQAKIDENAAKEAEIVYEEDPTTVTPDDNTGNGEGEGNGNGENQNNQTNQPSGNGTGKTDNTTEPATEPATDPAASEESGCSSSVSFATSGLLIMLTMGVGWKLFKKEEQ